MMEEIDKFQVPSAVQEAEMQAEMQPLVSYLWRLLLETIYQCLGIVLNCNVAVILGCFVCEAFHA